MKKYTLLLLLLLSGCIFVDESSPDRCNHLLDPSQKDNCLIMVATQTNNISKCSEIARKDISQQCYTMLLAGGATANATICDSMSGVGRDNCFSQLASKTNDSSLCIRINASFIRDNCFSRVAILKNNPSMCDAVSVSASRNLCKNQIFERLAVANRDVSYCKLLIAENGSNQDMADRCIFSMTKSLNDTSYCNQMTNIFGKELCLTGSIDPNSCNQIADSTGQQACLYVAAVYSNDPQRCTILPSPGMIDNCYIQVAKNTNNGKICNLVSSADLRDQCSQIVQQP